MNIQFPIGLDHCTIINKQLISSAEVFFPLGFVGDGNCSALSDAVVSSFVPSVRFVFDNAYVEAAQFPPELKEFYHYRKSDAGLHMVTLLTDSAKRLRSELITAGYEIPEIVVSQREGADHGENKGKAVFHLVEIPFTKIPDTHVAYLEHKTPELLYQKGRYRHPNTASRFEDIVLCMDDEMAARELAEQSAQLCTIAHSSSCPNGVALARIMDPVSFREEFGYPAGEQRCVFSALIFGVEDMECCRKFVETAGLDWHEKDGVLYVDAMDKLSLVIGFKRL